jgi:hypothetical protein
VKSYEKYKEIYEFIGVFVYSGINIYHFLDLRMRSLLTTLGIVIGVLVEKNALLCTSSNLEALLIQRIKKIIYIQCYRFFKKIVSTSKSMVK